MHAYLLVGKDKKRIKEKIDDITNSLKATKYYQDLTKISQVRELKVFTKLKVDKSTVIISHDVENASNAALNAFLKMLEEPQKNLHFILTTQNVHKVIPTVLSRCQVIRLKNSYLYDKALIDKYELLTAGSISDKFALITEYKDKEDAIIFLNNLIYYLYDQFKKDPNDRKLLEAISLSEETITNIKKNGNVKLQLSNLVINI